MSSAPIAAAQISPPAPPPAQTRAAVTTLPSAGTSPPRTLIENLKEVMGLIQIHEKSTGTGPGRRHNVGVLNKSAIVLTTACWEAFVEDVVTRGASRLSNQLAADKMPKKVKQAICRSLVKSDHELAAWELAGDGWRKAVRTYVAGKIEAFNNPKPERVNDLLENCLGLASVSSSWKWNGMSPEKACAKLEVMVQLRGQIAHRVSVSTYVTKAQAIDYLEFVQRLAIATGDAARKHIRGLTGNYPWPPLIDRRKLAKP